jgi:Ca-activated chloride channel family protein
MLQHALLFAGPFLLAAGAAMAQAGPRLILRVPAAEQPIEVSSLDTRVLIHGLFAQTTQTVVFRNPNNRVLDGELEFPLPDGATVNGFALDLDGQLVDGVVVQKDEARVILETEIRKGVDPGLVEQVRGNVYRTRVYPIPAKGTRTVRLRWVSALTTNGAQAAYHLPLPYDRPIGQVSLQVEVVQQALQPKITGGFGNVSLSQWQDRWVAKAEWKEAAPARDLLVELPDLPAQLLSLEPGGDDTFFAVSETVPAGAGVAPHVPKRIALAWDASGSRTEEATAKELKFISALLEAWPKTGVDLVVFRDRAEKPVAFEDAKSLLKALREAAVDGGTALAQLNLTKAALPNQDDALWVLCSDGFGTLGESLPKADEVPVWTVTGSSQADRALLRSLSQRTGAQLVENASAITQPAAGLLYVKASPGVADVQIVRGVDRSRISGRLLAGEAELTLAFGAGSNVTSRRVVKLQRSAAVKAGEGLGPVASAWAQARAEELSLFPEKNAQALLDLGRRFGLVTANTSLLVLETLQQHLQYHVEPALSRKELRREYLARVGELKQQQDGAQKSHLEEVVAMWKARVQWWKTDFKVPPGFRYEDEQVKRQREAVDRYARNRATGAPPPPASAMADEGVAGGISGGVVGGQVGGMAAAPARSMAARPMAMAKKADTAGPGTEASIAIKPWDPQVPYLIPLRKAAKGLAYAAYLAERTQHQSPAFFLDCAELFLRDGQKELGLRVLSNLAELRLDDPALLRVLAWRLSQAGELDLAAGILEKVLRLRPEEPQSKRDLALVLADRAETKHAQPNDGQRAVDLLLAVTGKAWDRFPEIELIALMEVNRILARAERRGQALNDELLDPRLHQLLDVDLRVSLAWDADMTDVDLHLFEPSGEHAFYGHNKTAIGGIVSRDITQGYGPEEYLVRKAMHGQYGVKVHYYGSHQQTLVGPATVTATVFTNWGRADEKRQTLTLRLGTPREMEEVGVVTIGGQSQAAAP